MGDDGHFSVREGEGKERGGEGRRGVGRGGEGRGGEGKGGVLGTPQLLPTLHQLQPDCLSRCWALPPAPASRV